MSSISSRLVPDEVQGLSSLCMGAGGLWWMMNQSPDDRKLWRLFGIGMELCAAVALMTFLGYLVDGWLSSSPWATVIGAMLGIVGGLYNLIKEATRSSR